MTGSSWSIASRGWWRCWGFGTWLGWSARSICLPPGSRRPVQPTHRDQNRANPSHRRPVERRDGLSTGR